MYVHIDINVYTHKYSWGSGCVAPTGNPRSQLNQKQLPGTPAILHLFIIPKSGCNEGCVFPQGNPR